MGCGEFYYEEGIVSNYVSIENANEFSVYLASGWFNESQMECMTRLYNFLIELGFIVNSPYYNGIAVNKENDSPEIRERAYQWNLDAIEMSDIVLTVIDDFDPGVIFEMGYAAGVSSMDHLNSLPEIISYSDVTGRGLNLMLQKASWAFANRLDELHEQLRRFVEGENPLNTLPYEKGDVV